MATRRQTAARSAARRSTPSKRAPRTRSSGGAAPQGLASLGRPLRLAISLSIAAIALASAAWRAGQR